MDPMQMRTNEDSAKPQQQQLSQQYSSVQGLSQANRDQIAASSINQIGRRPSAQQQQPSDLGVAPQSSIQRPDSRVGSAQKPPLSAHQQQPIPVQRPIQPQQQQQQQPPQSQPQSAQPQYQPRQILQQPQQPQPSQQPPQQQQQQFQAPRPVINRGPPPQQVTQQVAPGQQTAPQYHPVNRAPLPQQAPIPQQQQRPQLTRAQIPPQSQPPLQYSSAGQPNQPNYQSAQQQQRPTYTAPPQQQQQYNPSQSSVSDGQGIRVNQPNQPTQPYRPQIQTQQRPINPAYNPNLQNRLPPHLEERNKMAAEVNASNANQPSYLISNTDDVDDVIVRPIANMKIDQSGGKGDYDLKQQPPHQQPALRSSADLQKNASSVLQNQHPESHLPRATSQPQPSAKPAVAKRSPTEEASQRQNGTNGKTPTDDSHARAASRASSHKSQEDITRSSSRSRIKLLEKPAEPPKKVPMNKVKVGNAPPPNLASIRSKIGSLDNSQHKPGGGKVKIENKKIEFNVTSRIAAKNENYKGPAGGEKKIISTKLNWNAKSKVGSLENKAHKPGGGDKKILNFKTDFGNAKPKVGSKDSDIADKQSPETEEEDYFMRSTSLSASMSLPAECLVMSVTSKSTTNLPSARDNAPPGIIRAFHPRPFRLY